MGEPLKLTEVSKSFGSARIIDRLSLEVRAGEFLVFLGPSGCGKSTLLRLTAGLEQLDSGTIHIGDRRVDLLPPGKRDVAMVFQHYALYPHMSVRDNMSFGLKNAKVDTATIAERIGAAAKSLEIEELLDRRPGQLSGGQRQRVAIARAIVKQPALFLLDEPLSNLDAALRTRTRLEIAQLHERLGATMVFVTHDQVEAMTLADRIVVMNGGRIEQIGTPMEIYRRPRTRFVGEFVGSPKMNLIEAQTIQADNAPVCRLACGGEVHIPARAGALPDGIVHLGVRAEHVRPVAPELGATKAKVMIVERLGERTLVHAQLADGAPIVAEDSGLSEIRTGDTIGLAIDGSAATIFDQEGLAHHAEAGA